MPGINASALAELSSVQAGGVLGILNMFTGGALGRMSIFALNIMPYITSSIIMQLVTVLFKELENLKKEGESGRQKISQYTRYLTIILALFQGYGIAVGMEGINNDHGSIVLDPGLTFRMVTMITLTGGTIFVVWLSDQITLKGIGNGSSMIIFSGIVAGLPSAAASLLEMGRTGATSIIFILSIFIIVVGLILFIVFMEKAQRRISVQYPKRQVGNKVYGGTSTHLPLKLNTAGVIPPIFASSLLLFPVTIASFASSSASTSTGWVQFIMTYLGHGKPLYVLLYVLLIYFFSFFYTSVIFNPEETAENLKKNGAIILGRRPGKNTAEYLNYILNRLTVIGAIYIAFICVVPEILISGYAMPFYFGGTSLLIVVNVVIDLFTQIQTHLLSGKYENLIKKHQLRIIK